MDYYPMYRKMKKKFDWAFATKREAEERVAELEEQVDELLELAIHVVEMDRVAGSDGYDFPELRMARKTLAWAKSQPGGILRVHRLRVKVCKECGYRAPRLVVRKRKAG